jgi:hypothetical protein
MKVYPNIFTFSLSLSLGLYIALKSELKFLAMELLVVSMIDQYVTQNLVDLYAEMNNSNLKSMPQSSQSTFRCVNTQIGTSQCLFCSF